VSTDGFNYLPAECPKCNADITPRFNDSPGEIIYFGRQQHRCPPPPDGALSFADDAGALSVADDAGALSNAGTPQENPGAPNHNGYPKGRRK